MTKEQEKTKQIDRNSISRKMKRTSLREAHQYVVKSDKDGHEIVSKVDKDSPGLFKRQIDIESDIFEGVYGVNSLLQPAYDFTTLYKIYEESDVLQECVDVMVQNVDGFGYELIFQGNDVTETKTKEAVEEKIRLKDFFDFANDLQSWTAVRKLMREDLEVTGNAALEVVRNLNKEIGLIYQLPIQYLRASANHGKPVTITVSLPRNGKMTQLKVKRYFRRWAQRTPDGRKLRWFKEFGDPRFLDAITGEYKKTAKECKIVASEVMHFKIPFGGQVYGMPRWIGAILDAMGRRAATFVNYDLFDNQGIPPMAIMVSGGTLTDESLEELEAMVRSTRGIEKWNKIMILESQPESVGLEDKGTAKIELKNLSEYRKEDQMFANYLKTTEKAMRHSFRLPSLFVGGAETFTLATSKAAQTTVEEQVFIPERIGFDELVNKAVVSKELNVRLWKYRTRGPRLVGSDELGKGVRIFSQAGALSVNHSIHMANEAFGLQMSKFEEDWANYPVTIVMKLIESGRLKGLEKIADAIKEPAAQLPAPSKQVPIPTNVSKGGKFSVEEQALYQTLVSLQDAVELATACATTDEE